MTDKPVVDIKALASLARLEVSDAEVSKLETEIPGILSFVDTIQKVAVDMEKTQEGLRNVMRDDTNPHESGLYTKDLIEAAPAHEGNRIAVKQVLRAK